MGKETEGRDDMEQQKGLVQCLRDCSATGLSWRQGGGRVQGSWLRLGTTGSSLASAGQSRLLSADGDLMSLPLRWS